MFVDIWTFDNTVRGHGDCNKTYRSISIAKIVAIEHHEAHNSCVVQMDNGLRYAHHEQAVMLIDRINQIRRGD